MGRLIVNRELYVKVTEAAKLLGVHPDTLRNWDKSGAYKALRTPKGTRMYKIKEIKKILK